MPSRWPYVLGAIVIIIVALEVAPKIGGALLLFLVLAALIRSGGKGFTAEPAPSIGGGGDQG